MAETPRPLIDVLEERVAGVDRFYVGNKDPNFYYAWLNKKPEALETNKAIFGYEVVGAQHTETALVPPNAAGERVLGDLILARMPIERYNRLERIRKERTDSVVTEANEAWKAAAAEAGLLVEDSTRVSKQEIRG